MSVLDDLTNLDFSAIINARTSITTSGAALSLTLDKGAALSVLGDLGQAIDAVQVGLDDPAQLLRPLVDALLELAEPLRADIPLGPWFEAAQTGIRLLLEIIEVINGDPKNLVGLLTDSSADDLLRRANKLVADYSPVSLSGLAQFRQLVDIVEGRKPQDPGELAELAVRVLQPFEGRALRELRGHVDALLTAATQIDLPRTRLSGIQGGLNAVIVAAQTGEPAELERALHELARVRANTLNSLRNDLAQVSARVGQLPITPLIAPLHAVGLSLQSAEDGVLAFLEKWRSEIVAARTLLESTDFSQVAALINQGLDLVEDTARQVFVEPIDAAVAALKQWLRDLLAHLQLVDRRNEITAFLADVAQAITAANLDGVAHDARKVLNDIEQAISGDLVGAVQAKVGELTEQLDGFLQGAIDAMDTITTEINAIADQARGVLEGIIGALERFQQTIDQIAATIDQLGIEAATAQVIDVITTLRTTAEEVLKSVALPEPLRPAIEQLVAEIEQIDLDVVFAPAFQVAEMNVAIPDEVTQGLDAVAAALANLTPDALIAEVEDAVSQLLDVVRDFDPTTLLAGVTDAIGMAADTIRQLDPRPAVDTIRGPYQAVLDLLDDLHPDRFLAPVIRAWDGILGEVNLQSPQDAVRSLAGAINTAGEQLAQQAVTPIQQMAPAGTLEPRPAGETPAPSSPGSPQDPADLLPVRPGDVVRLFGYLPNKLRDYISQLEATVAQQFLAQLDGLGRGLATDLRAVPEAIMGIESRVLAVWDEMLLPIGQLQFGAQLAIEANFDGSRIDLQGSLDAVATVRPGQLRADVDGLLRETLRQVHVTAQQLITGAGNSLAYAVTQLEQNLLHDLTADLDDFLAALDPEPIAAELDLLIATALRRAPEALVELQDDLVAAFRRLERIIRELNPATLAQKFLTVTEVLEEQVNLLDPRRLAAELAEIHQAIKAIFLAYDPAIFAQEIFDIVDALAGALEALDPATLLGDLADVDAVLAKIEQAVPTTALAGIDSSLKAVGARLQALDPNALIAVINALPGRLVEAITNAIAAIKAEIIALLNAIKYASANASVRVEASATVG